MVETGGVLKGKWRGRKEKARRRTFRTRGYTHGLPKLIKHTSMKIRTHKRTKGIHRACTNVCVDNRRHTTAFADTCVARGVCHLSHAHVWSIWTISDVRSVSDV